MKLGKRIIEKLGDLDSIPSIYYLWQEAQEFVIINDVKKIKKYQNLIFLLHNSFVSPETRIGDNVNFGYGGIGVVVHKDCIIGDGVTISQNVTLGGTPGSVSVDANGEKFSVPRVQQNCYIACGTKVLGAVEIGEFTVLGANSVLLSSTDSFSVYAGNPAKKIKSINQGNCIKYRSFFRSLSSLKSEDYIRLFPLN